MNVMKQFLLILVALLGFVACTTVNVAPASAPVTPVVYPQIPDNTYEVSVVCDLPTAIAAGKYEWVDPDITPVNFPEAGCKPGKAEFTLAVIDGLMNSVEVAAELDRRGLRAATLPGLLAFGASHPMLQQMFRFIVVLGSQWRYPDGDVGVPVLDGRFGRRYLRLDWDGPGGGWDGRYHFLVARK